MTVFAISMSILSAVYILMGVFFITGLFVPHRRTSSRKPFVSVIIAARNEAAEIGECLRSVLNQDYPPESLEVIVVDDRSNDETARIVETMVPNDRRLRLVRVTDKPESFSGKKFALREGIRASRGELLLFTDADCRVGPQWVSSMIVAMTDDAGFVVGFSAVRAKTPFERLQRYDFGVLMTAACGSANWGMPMAASGQNLAYRRNAYDAAGGLDSVMERISGDDVLMMHLIRRKTAYRVVFASNAAAHVTTRAEATLAGFLQQRTRWASNADMMIRLNPVFFIYLLSVYCFHLSLVAGLALSAFFPLIAFVTLAAVANKLLIDGLAGWLGSRKFGLEFSLPLFFIWFVLQTPYTLWVGMKGLLRQFAWR
jgi:cellulose synthase/poly-beta-1,6-N-acetylglucosamine synthase-like glycosyltransferase